MPADLVPLQRYGARIWSEFNKALESYASKSYE